MDEEEENHYLKLGRILNDLLLTDTEEIEKKLELDGHIMNLILNMPDSCLKPLIPPIQTEESIANEMRYENHNMTTIHEMLRYLKSRFSPEPVSINLISSSNFTSSSLVFKFYFFLEN